VNLTGSLTEAMSKAKKIFLLNERRETWRIKLRTQRTAYCPDCDADVEWLTTHDAMRILQTTERNAIKLIDSSAVHSQEDDRGFLFFCRTSLEKLGAQEIDHEKA